MSSTQTLEQVMAKKKAILQGDAARIEKQRQAGKLTARERVMKLLDQGSFVEMDTLVACGEEGSGVVTGYGTVQDRPVYVFSQDYAVRGGAMGQVQARKILKVLDLAQKTGAPVVAMLDSAGVRLEEGALAMSAYAEVFAKMARLSGVCPMIALVLGPCVGTASLMAQLCDVSVMAQSVAELMLAGPQVMSALTGVEYTGKTLGGADVMAKQGMASLVCETEDEAMAAVVNVLDLLPGCNAEDAPIVDTDDMNRLMGAAKGCTSCALLADLCDNGAYVELNKEFGRALRTVLARVGGRSVGIVCSRSSEDEGRLDAAACQKAARFVRLCDCYSLPVISLVDTKGLALVKPENQGWLMAAAAQLLYAYAEATCPKATVITGNAIGPAYVAMGGKANADVCYAWPEAVISALTPEAAVQVLYKEEIAKSEGPALEARKQLADEYAASVADGVAAARSGMIDDVCDPKETRKLLIAAIEMLSSKRDSNPPKKHGNLPL